MAPLHSVHLQTLSVIALLAASKSTSTCQLGDAQRLLVAAVMLLHVSLVVGNDLVQELLLL